MAVTQLGSLLKKKGPGGLGPRPAAVRSVGAAMASAQANQAPDDAAASAAQAAQAAQAAAPQGAAAPVAVQIPGRPARNPKDDPDADRTTSVRSVAIPHGASSSRMPKQIFSLAPRVPEPGTVTSPPVIPSPGIKGRTVTAPSAREIAVNMPGPSMYMPGARQAPVQAPVMMQAPVTPVPSAAMVPAAPAGCPMQPAGQVTAPVAWYNPNGWTPTTKACVAGGVGAVALGAVGWWAWKRAEEQAKAKKGRNP
jgi:hypothetical protein